MTTLELVEFARAHDIHMEAHGQRLLVDGPVGVLTPELRAELRAQKRALLAWLHSSERLVPLRGGLTVPVAALFLALDLEARGLHLSTGSDHQFIVPADDPRLTPTDRAAIDRWRQHLGALVEYQTELGSTPDECADCHRNAS